MNLLLQKKAADTEHPPPSPFSRCSVLDIDTERLQQPTEFINDWRIFINLKNLNLFLFATYAIP